MDKIYKTKGSPKITCRADYRDVRLYINNILHFIIPRPGINDGKSDSIRLQSYFMGSKKGRRYIIEVGNGKNSDLYGYDNFDTWKTILNLLDEHI